MHHVNITPRLDFQNRNITYTCVGVCLYKWHVQTYCAQTHNISVSIHILRSHFFSRNTTHQLFWQREYVLIFKLLSAQSMLEGCIKWRDSV